VATSEVAVANSALIKLGAPQISALSDSVKSAQTINAIFDTMRKKLLTNHTWKFATKRIALSATANTPISVWTKEFLLGSDVLLVQDTNLQEDEPWDIEFNVDNNRVLVCNSDSVIIEYTKDITDPTKWPAYFDEALSCLIAANSAYAITQSRSKERDMWELYKMEVREARSLDSQQTGRTMIETNTWEYARY
jgi:hypothetical protein